MHKFAYRHREPVADLLRLPSTVGTAAGEVLQHHGLAFRNLPELKVLARSPKRSRMQRSTSRTFV